MKLKEKDAKVMLMLNFPFIYKLLGSRTERM